MKVTGTIAPSACDASLTGGTADFGKIAASQLSPDNFTFVGKKTNQLTITCGAPTRVAFKVIDSRSANIPSDINLFMRKNVAEMYSLYPHDMYSFGAVEGKQVGAYAIGVLGQVTGDDAKTSLLYSTNNGISWGGLYGVLAPAPRLHSMMPQDSSITEPAAFTTAVYPFQIAAALNKVADLPPLTDEVPMDGLVTFSLVYL